MNELNLKKQTVDKYVANFVSYSCYLSQVEPTKVEEVLQDESWVEAMHVELHQFQRNDAWTIVIGTKWIFRIKTVWTLVPRLEGVKAKFVAQGYTQVGGVNFHETFAPVAHIESV